MRRSTRAGHCAAPAANWSSAKSARTAGSRAAPSASWPISRRAGRRCTGCSMRRWPRFWRSSASGAKPTDPTASWPTAAHTWAGCGCRRPASGEYFTWRTSTSVPCRGRRSLRGGRFRTGSSTSRTRSGSTTRTHFTWARSAALIIEDRVSRKWITEVVSAEETSTQVEIAFTDALEIEGLLDAVHTRLDNGPSPLVDPSTAPTCRRAILYSWKILSYHSRSMYRSCHDGIRFVRSSWSESSRRREQSAVAVALPAACIRSRGARPGVVLPLSRCAPFDWPTAMKIVLFCAATATACAPPKTTSRQNRGRSGSGWHGSAG
jgi:hypothetical protein